MMPSPEGCCWIHGFPLDKMGWMMIRLYAQNNEGAIFPSYDELQVQLASRVKVKPPVKPLAGCC